jgi:hypothetical protein
LSFQDVDEGRVLLVHVREGHVRQNAQSSTVRFLEQVGEARLAPHPGVDGQMVDRVVAVR